MIKKISITNFKAIQHCLNLPLQPFTVFIGNNGSGKSSVMEALRTLHMCLTQNIQEAFSVWGGLDKVRNYHGEQTETTVSQFGFKQKHQPIIIWMECEVNKKVYEYQVSFNLSLTGDNYIVENEELHCNGTALFATNAIDNNGNSFAQIYTTAFNSLDEMKHKSNTLLLALEDGSPLILHPDIAAFQKYVTDWQFLYLNAHEMGKPVMQNRLTKNIRLDYDGRNIAEYILWIRSQGQEYLDSLVQKMIFVLPYIKQIQPNIQETFNREVELLLHEAHDSSKPLPGWLLSSGTLRILALLSVFDTPQKASVLFVDEIENGLDPRTIGLLLNEIRNETTSGEMQIVITTHSPYLLDMLPIESIIVTEKKVDFCKYHIPATEERLKAWIEKFTPGRLFTTGKFSR
ncbi:MAG: AAA family ATPase [Chitinophagaceae bacterium]|nr:AAA family ATPase [Chitinophagaceae bacterium]